MEGHQQPHNVPSGLPQMTYGGGGMYTILPLLTSEDRETVSDRDDKFLAQWSVEEIRDFLKIRGELDQKFMETKQDDILWEFIANDMNLSKDYNRSADQCKSKWKNLVTLYKGCVTMKAEAQRQQFPFYNELQEIFMQRMLRMEEQRTQLNLNQMEGKENGKKKRKLNENTNNVGNLVGNLKEILDEFMKKQMGFEMQMIKEIEKREEERRKKEMEWREKIEEERRKKEMEWRENMKALEMERLMMEKRWREKEEEWRMKQEEKADKRDAIIDALIKNLKRKEDTSDSTTKIGIIYQ